MLNLTGGREAGEPAENRNRQEHGALRNQRNDANHDRARESAPTGKAHRSAEAESAPKNRLQDSSTVEWKHRDEVEQQKCPRHVVGQEQRKLRPITDLDTLHQCLQAEGIGDRDAPPLPGCETDPRSEHRDETNVDKRTADRCPEMGGGTLRRRARGQSTKRPNQNLIRGTGFRSARDRVAKLVQQHDGEQRAEPDERGDKPKCAPTLNADRLRNGHQHKDDEKEMQPHRDSEDPEDRDRPGHRIVERHPAPSPIAAVSRGASAFIRLLPRLPTGVHSGTHCELPSAR